MIKYMYVSITRIIAVILAFVAFVGMGMWIWGVDCSYWAFIGCYAYALGLVIFLFEKFLTTPPYELPIPVAGLGDTIDFSGTFGSKCFDEDGNYLGVCKGAYLTKQDIRLMVDNKMYNVEDVYFEEDKEDE